jgi:hypothetical protein
MMEEFQFPETVSVHDSVYEEHSSHFLSAPWQGPGPGATVHHSEGNTVECSTYIVWLSLKQLHMLTRSCPSTQLEYKVVQLLTK